MGFLADRTLIAEAASIRPTLYNGGDPAAPTDRWGTASIPRFDAFSRRANQIARKRALYFDAFSRREPGPLRLEALLALRAVFRR
jgi:hypothetical protein